MAVSLASLLTPVTEEEALDLALATLSALGFNVTSWQDGSTQRTLVQLGATLYSSVTSTVAQIAAAGFNQLSSAGWLDVLSEDYYGNTRVAGVVTQGVMRLTASAAAPPVAITADVLQIADTATALPTTHTYRNTSPAAPVVLAPGGTLDIDVEAEVAGTGSNIANSVPLFLWTSLVGVTCTNPPVGATGTWITRAGTDQETDARLQTRNTSKWSTLSYAAVDGAYKNWALAADTSVTRVKVRSNNPYGPGSIDVVCATAIGGITPAQADAIRQYILGNNPDGSTTGRRPLGDIVTVQTASAIAFTVSGTVTVDADYTATTTATVIRNAILAVLNATDIGGTIIPPAATGVVVHSKIVAAVEALDGVISASITTPAADSALTELQVIDQTAVNFAGLTVVYG